MKINFTRGAGALAAHIALRDVGALRAEGLLT